MSEWGAIRNVFCVGRNYRLHAAELGNEVPKKPMFFSKPTHALVALDGREIRLPADEGEIHYEAELVLHIGTAYEQGMTVEQLVDKLALGIDFTLRDVQSELKQKGHPWLSAKGFRHSAPLTRFIDFPGAEAIDSTMFSLEINGVRKQAGTAAEMIFPLQRLLDDCARQFGLGEGDIVYTGTPAGVGRVVDGDSLVLRWGDAMLGEGVVRLGR